MVCAVYVFSVCVQTWATYQVQTWETLVSFYFLVRESVSGGVSLSVFLISLMALTQNSVGEMGCVLNVACGEEDDPTGKNKKRKNVAGNINNVFDR